MDSEREKETRPHESAYDDDMQTPLLGATSPGVKRMEVVAAHLTFINRIFVFLSVFLIAYAYSLDGTIRYTYQVHSKLNSIRSPKLTDLDVRYRQLLYPFAAGDYQRPSKRHCLRCPGKNHIKHVHAHR